MNIRNIVLGFVYCGAMKLKVGWGMSKMKQGKRKNGKQVFKKRKQEIDKHKSELILVPLVDLLIACGFWPHQVVLNELLASSNMGSLMFNL